MYVRKPPHISHRIFSQNYSVAKDNTFWRRQRQRRPVHSTKAVVLVIQLQISIRSKNLTVIFICMLQFEDSTSVFCWQRQYRNFRVLPCPRFIFNLKCDWLLRKMHLCTFLEEAGVDMSKHQHKWLRLCTFKKYVFFVVLFAWTSPTLCPLWSSSRGFIFKKTCPRIDSQHSVRRRP